MAEATIGGKTILGSDTASWKLRPGIAPTVLEFDLMPEDAEDLLDGKLRPVTLEMDTEGAKRLFIDFLYVLERRPAENPNLSRVRVADRRWFWPRAHVLRRFNVRREVGFKRLDDPASAPVARPVVPEIAYAPWSLNNGQPWRAKQALDDVFKEILKVERDAVGEEAELIVTGDVGGRLAGFPIESLEIDDTGDRAAGRMVGHFPEAAVTVDPRGTVRIFSRASGGEAPIHDAAGPPSVGGGTVVEIVNSRTRPRRVDSLITRKLEVRFDYSELETGGTAPGRLVDDRFLENVLPVPDFSLTLATGEVVPQGTWITFAQAIDAWGSIPIKFDTDGVAQISLSLSQAAIRAAMVPFMDLWASFRIAGQRDPDADWSARIAAVNQHWRRTFRINRRWIDRFLSWEVHRVATLDPTTGTRAPSVAYTNWFVLHTQRSKALDALPGGLSQDRYGVNSPPFNGGDLDSNVRASPARVTILDHDQGILHIDFLMDELRVFEMFIPGHVENMPSGAGLGGEENLWFNGVTRVNRNQLPQLKANHRLAVVISAIPASPNTDQQLMRIPKKGSDVASHLPPSLRQNISQADGPVMEVRVGAGLETARVAWKDSAAGEIEKAFGVREGEPQLDELTINLGSDVFGASLEAISVAVAARVYASFADRREGSQTVRLEREAEVDGFLEEILHSVSRDGRVETRYTISQRDAEPDLVSFLPASTRRVLFKLK